MIPTNGSSFGRAGGRPRRYPGGTENASIFATVRGSIPNRRAASRRLIPSTYTARRTCPYSSTPFIPQPSAHLGRRLLCCRSFAPALPDYPAASLRDFLSGALTVIRWHRRGFRAYWRWKSRHVGGSPRIDSEMRALIRRMSRENPLWGAPRIHGELLMLGIEVAESTVGRYMVRRRRPPSQGWRTFLRNHAAGIASLDLFVVRTISFKLLYGLVILRHARRRLVTISVTSNPTAEWIAGQVTDAFPWDEAPHHLMRDRDGAFGPAYTRRIRAMEIRDHPSAPRSPWQSGHVERLIGSIRRESLDHLIVFGEAHLHSVLKAYASYYNEVRTHRLVG